jgi:hypothetical protein
MKFKPVPPGLLCVLAVLAHTASQAADPPLPVITNFQAQGAMRSLRFAPYPAADAYAILATSNLSASFAPDAAFQWRAYTNTGTTNIGGYEWRSTNGSGPAGFYRVGVTPMADSNRLAATVLQRLTYGPTPDELDRIRSIGPEIYLAEQLAPWSLAETAELADTNIAFLGAKFAALDEPITNSTKASLTDFRAWHVLRAVNAKRQLLEILLQFLENHFVTEYGKSYNWLNNNYVAGIRRSLAAQMEYAENQRWRAALLNPQCTFHDLLRISAESPAMIIYLDTVTSRGDGGRIANENYARELFELFCWGVDNGYDQNDITVLSRA